MTGACRKRGLTPASWRICEPSLVTSTGRQKVSETIVLGSDAPLACLLNPLRRYAERFRFWSPASLAVPFILAEIALGYSGVGRKTGR